MIVELQDERDFAGELGGSRLQEAQRRRVGVTSGFAGQREMVARIVSGGIGREARAGPCSKPRSTGRMTNIPVPTSGPD